MNYEMLEDYLLGTSPNLWGDIVLPALVARMTIYCDERMFTAAVCIFLQYYNMSIIRVNNSSPMRVNATELFRTVLANRGYSEDEIQMATESERSILALSQQAAERFCA